MWNMRNLKVIVALAVLPFFLGCSLGSSERDVSFVLAIALCAFIQESIKHEAKRLNCRWYHVVLFPGNEEAIRSLIQKSN